MVVLAVSDMATTMTAAVVGGQDEEKEATPIDEGLGRVLGRVLGRLPMNAVTTSTNTA